ncbi:hypothetical protein [Pedobacter punctiformis]|uniref:Uncharacterized protein n=1 Tax=Pedobacter punctiformis TaxID=3004097 RepID=A0ABT4LF47_9SPHI|nr:hypothetical protein [Pedobacter sp. HCMS5-2]MCZ4245459.1 hypothetical protein [Pedobacter sp. HCMS5-2]
MIDKESRSRKAVILALLIICILVVAGTAFLLYYNANGGQNGIKTYLSIGVILSFVMWWIAHYKDEAFNPPVSSLGGSTDKPLRN